MPLTLTIKAELEVPLEAEALVPDTFIGLSQQEISSVGVLYGNRQMVLGDFFGVSGNADDELRLEGDLSRVKMVGADMKRGRLILDGPVGAHLGVGMSGGEIRVKGSAGDWVGPEMLGGRIVIEGDAGHAVGSAYRGSRIGMRGGEIFVFGHAGNEVGSAMKRGLIAIGGDCGDFTGVNMLGGTIVVFGEMGWRPGASLRRGTIVAMQASEVLPTYSYACRYKPGFLRLYLLHLRALGLPVSDQQLEGKYLRYSGDSIELNRGEILFLDRSVAAS